MGQVGVGNTSFYPSPANPGLSNVMGIDAGLNHTCAVHENGTISCWGKNSNGQLGNGTETDGLAPSLVLSINDAVQVASGVAHSCALHANGKMSCWGNNASGALGDGSLESSSQPVFVQGLD
jgi:alpha-tubulin suppressor-like RCC1 family protein